MKCEKGIDTTLICMGTAIGITDIETILGIIVLSFQVFWILIKSIIKISKAIKNKNINELLSTIEDGKNELEDLKESLKDGDINE